MKYLYRNPAPVLWALMVVSHGEPTLYASQESDKKVSAFIPLLKDPNPMVRASAVEKLGSFGPQGKEAMPALIEALGDQSISPQVVAALVEIGEPSAPFLIQAMSNKDPAIRSGAALALGLLDPKPANAVPSLLKALKDPEPDVRKNSVESLSGIKGREVIPALLDVLEKDSNQEVRAYVAASLANFGSKSRVAVPALVKALSAGGDLGFNAAVSLRHIGPAAVPELVKTLEDSDKEEIHAEIAYILGTIGCKAKGAIPALTRALRDKKPEVQENAAIALGLMGPDAKGATPALATLLTDSSPLVRVEGARALYKIGGMSLNALPALREALQNNDPEVRHRAEGVLAEMGPDAKGAVQDLVRAIGDSDEDVGLGAIYALGSIGASGKASVPSLREALKSGKTSYRYAAARALGKMAHFAKEAIPDLQNATRDQDPFVRKEAIDALEAIRGKKE